MATAISPSGCDSSVSTDLELCCHQSAVHPTFLNHSHCRQMTSEISRNGSWGCLLRTATGSLVSEPVGHLSYAEEQRLPCSLISAKTHAPASSLPDSHNLRYATSWSSEISHSAPHTVEFYAIDSAIPVRCKRGTGHSVVALTLLSVPFAMLTASRLWVAMMGHRRAKVVLCKKHDAAPCGCVCLSVPAEEAKT